MIEIVLGLLGLWVLLGAVWLAVHPLIASPHGGLSPRELELQDLEVEKARLIREIHELELDYATGKLSDTDRASLEHRLRSKAVEVMQEIENRKKRRKRKRGTSAGRSSG